MSKHTEGKLEFRCVEFGTGPDTRTTIFLVTDVNPECDEDHTTVALIEDADEKFDEAIKLAERFLLTWNSHDALVGAMEGALHYLVNILEIPETDKDIQKWVDAITAAGGSGP